MMAHCRGEISIGNFSLRAIYSWLHKLPKVSAIKSRLFDISGFRLCWWCWTLVPPQKTLFRPQKPVTSAKLMLQIVMKLICIAHRLGEAWKTLFWHPPRLDWVPCECRARYRNLSLVFTLSHVLGGKKRDRKGWLTRHHDVIVTRPTRAVLVVGAATDCPERREVLHFVEVEPLIAVVVMMIRVDATVGTVVRRNDRVGIIDLLSLLLILLRIAMRARTWLKLYGIIIIFGFVWWYRIDMLRLMFMLHVIMQVRIVGVRW